MSLTREIIVENDGKVFEAILKADKIFDGDLRKEVIMNLEYFSEIMHTDDITTNTIILGEYFLDFDSDYDTKILKTIVYRRKSDNHIIYLYGGEK